MTQMGRNAIDETSGYLRQHRYVIHDRDTKFCQDLTERSLAAWCPYRQEILMNKRPGR
jgi:hypothetical protein